MKVIAINGSHRKGRNTAALLQTILDELNKSGSSLHQVGKPNIEKRANYSILTFHKW